MKLEISEKNVILANELIRSAQGLNLNEKRLLMLAVSKLKYKSNPNLENATVKIFVSEMIGEFNLNQNKAYQETKKAAEGIMKRQIRLKPTNIDSELIQWVGKSKYSSGEGWVLLEFYIGLFPYLFELKKHFTKYNLTRAGAFKSVYTWRIFELIQQFKKTGVLKIKLDEFNHMLEVPETYIKDFGLLRTRVIEPSIKEIREKDGLNISWETVKSGRKVIALEFKFPIEQQTTLPFQNSEKLKIKTPKPTSKLKTQTDLENAYDLEHMKRLAELGGVPLETLLKRS